MTSHTAYNFLCAANPFISSKGSEGPTHWDRNFWLERSFFDVALAAEIWQTLPSASPIPALPSALSEQDLP